MKAPTDFWLRALHFRDDKRRRERQFRIEASLPRELSQKLNAFQAESTAKTGRYVSKSDIVVAIIEQFFDSKT
jgi:hypothetical protein